MLRAGIEHVLSWDACLAMRQADGAPQRHASLALLTHFLQVCEERGLTREMVYVLGRMGSADKASQTLKPARREPPLPMAVLGLWCVGPCLAQPSFLASLHTLWHMRLSQARRASLGTHALPLHALAQALRLIVEGLRDVAQAVEFVQLQVRVPADPHSTSWFCMCSCLPTCLHHCWPSAHLPRPPSPPYLCALPRMVLQSPVLSAPVPSS